jgi:Histidine kinase-, DNA gyrase B-, and HSP90-like ATPase
MASIIGKAAVLVVRNEGLGIPQDDLPYVFDRFHRGANVVGRFVGTGIGLASARELVELYGGRISVESEEAPAACSSCACRWRDKRSDVRVPCRPRSRSQKGNNSRRHVAALPYSAAVSLHRFESRLIATGSPQRCSTAWRARTVRRL